VVDPVVAQPTPPKTPLIVLVNDGFGRGLPDAEVEVVNFRTELNGTSKDVKKQSNAQGRAEFGLVDPRIKFDIKVRKTGFGPPAKPFTPGENGTVRRPLLKGRAIELVLTRNVGRLIVVARDATVQLPLAGASIGVDGITGSPMPLSGADGRAGSFDVPVGVPVRFHIEKANFGPQPGGTPFNGVVADTHTFDDGEIFVATLLLHQSPLVSPRIDQSKIVLAAKKPHTTPRRQRIVLSVDAPFDGLGGVSLAGTGAVKFFDAATDGREILATTRGFNAAELQAGFPLFVEGAAANGTQNGLTLTLALTGGTKTKLGPARMTITVVDATLVISQSRTAVGADPVALPAAAPNPGVNAGRFVHRQINNAHGRARLVVKDLQPPDFSGQLTLVPISAAGSGGVALFAHTAAAPAEVAAPGQAALANPHEFAASGGVGAGLTFFAEGAGVSGRVGDTGYRLGIKGVEDALDHVAMTVVQFSDLLASVPTTPPLTARLGNATAPARSTLTVGAGTPPAATAFDEDLVLNPPLVLIENSITGADRVNLSVKVLPAGTPVRWSARRDTRPAPNGDNPAISSLSPAPPAQPTLTPSGLNATLMADSVGTFTVCAYVDCNGNNTQDFNDPTSGARIDREPFILMPVVLVRAQAFKNTSKQQTPNVTVSPAAPAVPTSATGIAFSTGSFSGGPGAAGVHNDAVVTLIGGGRFGRIGLDKVFAGWVNNVVGMNSVASYLQTFPPAAPGAPPAPPPATHTMTSLMATNTVAVTTGVVSAATVVTRFVPAGTLVPAGSTLSTAAPASTAVRSLDVSPFTDAGTGGHTAVGTEGLTAARPVIAVVKTTLPAAGHALTVGEDWRVQMFDSPGFSAGSVNPAFPGRLTAFSFNVDFSCDLCVWTNMAGLPGPTNDPASRLYASVQSNTWRVRCDASFAAAAPFAATINNRRVEITPDAAPARLAAAVAAGSPVEVRFPTALAMWSQDCNT